MVQSLNHRILIVREDVLPRLETLIKRNNIRNLQEFFEGSMALMERYLQAINEGRMVYEVDEKTGQVFELVIDWKIPRKPTLVVL
jgi:hypothetical protein